MNAEYAQVGLGGQRWGDRTPAPAPPNFLDSWHQLKLGTPRDLSIYDEVFVNEGTNGAAPSAATVSQFLSDMRGALKTGANLFLMVPFGGFARVNLTAGYNAYKMAHPDDGRTFLMDLGNVAYTTTDGTHPDDDGQFKLKEEVLSVRATLLSNADIQDQSLSDSDIGRILDRLYQRAHRAASGQDAHHRRVMPGRL